MTDLTIGWSFISAMMYNIDSTDSVKAIAHWWILYNTQLDYGFNPYGVPR